MPSTDKPNRKGIGGNATHKNPDCRCPGCTARRRKAEALFIAARDGGAALENKDVKEVIEADEGIMVASPIGRGQDPVVDKDRIGRWLVLRATDPGITLAEASTKIGIAARTLSRSINRAVKEGWLKFDDPLERVEHEIIPKTLDNLSRFLDEGDRVVTIEAAKGTVFPAYKASKEVGHSTQPILALKIELAPGIDPTIAIGGNVFGRPKVIDVTPEPVNEGDDAME